MRSRFLRRLLALIEEGRSFATARLLEVRGSAPQEPGAAMIVFPDGSSELTIGGGRFEATVILDALQLMRSSDTIALREYALTEDEMRMLCAGKARVLLEVYRPSAELLVFGGGHVGEALVRLAAETGLFRITVVDDRAEYASSTRHPKADRTVLTDPTYSEGIPARGSWTYAVIVTRCHDVDFQVLRRLVREPLAYLGMIASKTKAREIRSRLEVEGVPADALDRIHSPIGLPIGGKDPAVIAVSILAEILKVMNERAPGAPFPAESAA